MSNLPINPQKKSSKQGIASIGSMKGTFIQLLILTAICFGGYHNYQQLDVIKAEQQKLDELQQELDEMRSALKSRLNLIKNTVDNSKRFSSTLPHKRVKAQEPEDNNSDHNHSHSEDSKLGVGGEGDFGDSVMSSSQLGRWSLASGSLLEVADSMASELESIPFGVPANGRLSSGYGLRKSPFSKRKRKRKVRMHRGLDIAIDRYTRVNATARGTVKVAGWKSGYGKSVVIDHGNGFTTKYAHLQEIYVEKGQEICKDQNLGSVGSTGRSTGPHLHYEVRFKGKAMDPMVFIDAGMELSEEVNS